MVTKRTKQVILKIKRATVSIFNLASSCFPNYHRSNIMNVPFISPVLALSGHLDTVAAGDFQKWTYPPFAGQLVDGKIYGRGAVDMKSGLAAMVVFHHFPMVIALLF